MAGTLGGGWPDPIEIEGYEVLGMIGEVDMGRIFKARQESLNRVVVLKLLDPLLAADPEQVKRFMREARSAARLHHPNIVAFYDVGTCGDSSLHYLAMEYVEGVTLARLLEQEGRLSERRALEITLGVAWALSAAEDEGVLHRDIQPNAIRIGLDGIPKLIDLGRAKREEEGSITKTGVLLGTPHTLAPERILGKPMDIRSDLYSLGVTTYRMLTGVWPHRGETFLEITGKHVREEVPNPCDHVPGLMAETGRIVRALCAREPTDRPATARAAAMELGRLVMTFPEEVKPAPEERLPTTRWLLSTQTKLKAMPIPFSVRVDRLGVEILEQTFDQDVVIIGRSADCDIQIDEPIVSRRHAEIRREYLDFTVCSLSTTNTTTLNGDALLERAPLDTDDVMILSGEFYIRASWDVDPTGEIRISPEGSGDAALDDLVAAAKAREEEDINAPTPPAWSTEGSDTGAHQLDPPTQPERRVAHQEDPPTEPQRVVRREPSTKHVEPPVPDSQRRTGYLVFLRTSSQVHGKVNRVFQIGSSPSCELRLPRNAPRKVAIVVDCPDGFRLVNVAADPGLVRINDMPVPDQALLQEGDVLDVYGEELSFSHSPPKR